MATGKRILIVDDEEDIRHICKKALESDGHQVDTTGDPVEGLEKFRAEGADLVILDIRMPEMDGLEFLTRARELDHGIPIILCSAYAAYKEDFRTWGADEFIVKSMDLKELRETVHRFLSGNSGTIGDSAAAGEEGRQPDASL
jgi:DNA-binding response OmpR family regulator